MSDVPSNPPTIVPGAGDTPDSVVDLEPAKLMLDSKRTKSVAQPTYCNRL